MALVFCVRLQNYVLAKNDSDDCGINHNLTSSWLCLHWALTRNLPLYDAKKSSENKMFSDPCRNTIQLSYLKFIGRHRTKPYSRSLLHVLYELQRLSEKTLLA